MFDIPTENRGMNNKRIVVDWNDNVLARGISFKNLISVQKTIRDVQKIEEGVNRQ